jgi:hypothetical protein
MNAVQKIIRPVVNHGPAARPSDRRRRALRRTSPLCYRTEDGVWHQAGSGFTLSTTAQDVQRTGTFAAVTDIALVTEAKNWSADTNTLAGLNAFDATVTGTVGDAYIIASPAIGIFAGQELKVAICEVADSFEFYTPGDGEEVYDNDTRRLYRWSSTALAWEVVEGIHHEYISTSASGTTDVAGTPYTYSASTPPTTAHLRIRDDSGRTFTARPGGEKLLIKYDCIVRILTAAGGLGTGNTVLAIYRGSETNAIAHCLLPEADYVVNEYYERMIHREFIVTAPNNDEYTYYAAITKRSGTGGTSIDGAFWRNRLLQVEEKS